MPEWVSGIRVLLVGQSDMRDKKDVRNKGDKSVIPWAVGFALEQPLHVVAFA
jgi:hypothetical protein